MTTPDVRGAGNDSGKVTRGAVLAAALEIIDRDGADAPPPAELRVAVDDQAVMGGGEPQVVPALAAVGVSDRRPPGLAVVRGRSTQLRLAGEGGSGQVRAVRP